MSDETQQPTTADAESSGVSKPESTSPEATLDKVSEPSSGPSQDFQSTGQASIPPSSSESTLATPDEVGGLGRPRRGRSGQRSKFRK